MSEDFDWKPERTLWQRMPKRTLYKGFWLLLLLGGVLWFQLKSTSCAVTYTENIAPQLPGKSQPKPKEQARTVQMAPLPAAAPDAGRNP